MATGDKERIARRRARVFELRAQGHPIREIASIWSGENPSEPVGKTQIHKDLQAELEMLAAQTYEKVVHVRELTAAKLDHLYSRKKFLAKLETADLSAYDRAIKMIQEYAKLYGAYMPTKTAQTDSAGNDVGQMTDEERQELVLQLLDTARARALAAEGENVEEETQIDLSNWKEEIGGE
jgi:hypothetical protein